MKRLELPFCLLLICGTILKGQEPKIKSAAEEYCGNPVITDIFTADPCPLVHDDTLYLFTGHDEQNEVNEWFYMRDWYIFSTDNMYDYTNHGASLAVSDFSWAQDNAFAGHCIEHNGKFWWYLSIKHKTIKVGEGFSIGVAVADNPLGPYTDAKGSAIITDYTYNSVTLNIDPAVFIDDDGKVFLFWGSWSAIRMVELDTNMVDMKSVVTTPAGVSNFFEAPFVHKRKDIYYLTYASGYPSTTHYAISSSITGPWTYKGQINGLVPNSSTNHQGVVEYKDNWYFVYHSAGIPTGGTYRRSVCIDMLEYDNNGLIIPIIQTETSVPAVEGNTKVSPSHVENPVRVFPNPSRDGKISIEVADDEYMNQIPNLFIFNATGILVFSIQNPPKQIEIQLEKGIYIMRMNVDRGQVSKRIIVL